MDRFNCLTISHDVGRRCGPGVGFGADEEDEPLHEKSPPVRVWQGG